MADEIGFGVVDDGCEVFGSEGLFCMDSSAIPTSLGVNPSLTISAVCERAAERLVARGDDFGLPASRRAAASAARRHPGRGSEADRPPPDAKRRRRAERP